MNFAKVSGSESTVKSLVRKKCTLFKSIENPI